MNVTDAEEYTLGLGQTVAGSWRLIALGQRLGVPKALGLSTKDWVETRLGGYIRLSLAERREAVVELTGPGENGGLSQRQAAEVLGVDEITVRRDRATNVAPDSHDQDALGDRATNVAPSPPKPTEAERVEAERRSRTAAWAEKLRLAIDVIERMAEGPIPPELADALGPDDVRRLTALLRAFEPAF
jgi:hypothetical protein